LCPKARKLLEKIQFDNGAPAPEFFVEKAKQTKFTCNACGNVNDILGRYSIAQAAAREMTTVCFIKTLKIFGHALTREDLL